MSMIMNTHHGTSQLQACVEMIREAEAGESVGVVTRIQFCFLLFGWINLLEKELTCQFYSLN